MYLFVSEICMMMATAVFRDSRLRTCRCENGGRAKTRPARPLATAMIESVCLRVQLVLSVVSC